jgi:hypothetical protein
MPGLKRLVRELNKRCNLPNAVVWLLRRAPGRDRGPGPANWVVICGLKLRDPGSMVCSLVVDAKKRQKGQKFLMFWSFAFNIGLEAKNHVLVRFLVDLRSCPLETPLLATLTRDTAPHQALRAGLQRSPITTCPHHHTNRW